MDEQMMNAMGQEGMWMMICMIATALFVFIIGVCVIIQTFLQAKMLRELRNKEK
jgi:hypothetical protein